MLNFLSNHSNVSSLVIDKPSGMIKRLMALYIALHLALAPAVSAFASNCSSMKEPGSFEMRMHHQASARHDHSHHASGDTHQHCHDSEEDNHSDQCGCHCSASTSGLVNTFSPRLAHSVTVPFDALAQTQHSVTDTPLFKPPRA